MAGGFLADEFEANNPEYAGLGVPRPSRRRKDPLRMVRWFEQMDQQDERARQDQAALQRLQNPPAPTGAGMGDFRKAEADMAEEQRLQDPAEREKWLQERDLELARYEQELDAFTEETLRLTPGLDDIRRRAEIVEIERANLTKAKEQQAELWADLKRAKLAPGAVGDYYALTMLEQEWAADQVNPIAGKWSLEIARRLGLHKLFGGEDLAEKLQNDETFRQQFTDYAIENHEAIKQLLHAYQAEATDPSLLEKIVANSPLQGVVETLGGLASLPAEGLAQLLGTERGRFQEQLDAGEYIANFNPWGLAANALGLGTSDSALRRRGREFYSKAGDELALADLELERITGVSAFDLMTLQPRYAMQVIGSGFRDWGLPAGTTHKTKEFWYRLGLEIATDPLNLIDFGGRAVTKPSKILGEFAKSNKYMTGARKFWAALTGHAKDARAIGDPALIQAHAAEQAYARGGVGPGALRIAQDARAFMAQRISKLAEPQAREALELLPGAVERTDQLLLNMQASGQAITRPEARRIMVEAATSDDVVREALFDAAEYLDDLNLRSIQFENAFGGHTQYLSGDYGYYMTLEDPLFAQWKAQNKTAARLLEQFDGAFAKDQFSGAVAQWERGRLEDWRHLDLYEKEAKLRELLRPHGLKDNIPIFSRDAFENIAKRAESNLKRLKERAFFENATVIFNTNARADPETLAKLVEQAADEAEAAKWLRAIEADLGLAEKQALQQGLKQGQKALRGEVRAAGREAGQLEQAAEGLGKLEAQGAEVGEAMSRGNTLRRIFSQHPNIAEIDEADRTVRSLVQKVTDDIAKPPKRFGTGFSRDAQRRATQAVTRFERAYASATSKKGARDTIRGLRDDLRAIVPKSLAREYDRLAQNALSRLDGLTEAAEGVLAKGVGKAVAKDVRQAGERAEQAFERAAAADISTWSAARKAQWVRTVAKNNGMAPPSTHVDGIEIYARAGVNLPEDIGSLAQLAQTHVDAEGVAKMLRWKKDFYSGGLIDKNSTAAAVGAFLDGLKVIYQKSLLSRGPSMARDLWGQLWQAAIAADDPRFIDDVAQAVKDLGGDPVTWSKGLGTGWKAPDDVLQLMSEGVLNTTVSEAQVTGNMARLADQAAAAGGVKKGLEPVLRGLSAIEEKGVIGAALGTVSEKAGQAAKKFTDFPLNARVWTEQTLRLGTYRQAIRKGASHAEAVEEVYKLWGKFDELTNLDRKVLSRILFFWAWRRASIPIALRNMLDYPVRSKLTLALTAYVQNTTKENWQEIDQQAQGAGVPEWFRRMGGWIIGVDENGNADAIGTGGSTYFSPAVSLLNSDMAKALAQGDADEAFWQAGRELVRASPPFYQQILERLEEKDYFSNKPWRDESGQSTVKAPTALWWFMNHADKKPNAFEKWLGLTAHMDAEGNLREVTMDPEKAWLFDWIPGASATMADLSAFADPRQADTQTGLMLPTGKELDLSLFKGGARAAGVPVYRMHLSDEQQLQVTEARKALGESLRELAGETLIMDDYGAIVPNYQSERGKRLREDRAKWEAEARQQGLGKQQARAYVNQRMMRFWFDEWRVMELGDRLRNLQGKTAAMQDVPPSTPDTRRFTRQRDLEREREDRELRRLLGIK